MRDGERPRSGQASWAVGLSIGGVVAVVFTWLAVSAATTHGRPWWPALIAPVVAGAATAVVILVARRGRSDGSGVDHRPPAKWRWIIVAAVLGVTMMSFALALASGIFPA
jgi:CHASE2 domain-containing sensor protein